MMEAGARRRFQLMPERTLGRFGEDLWARIFQESKVPYIPLCRIETGRAPMLEGNAPSVLPDFDLIGDGWQAYVDSKAKTHLVVFHLANEERHGIERRHMEDYIRTGALGRKDCGLAILELFGEKCEDETCEEWSGSLLIESFANLGTPINGIKGSSLEDRVFWPRKRFVDLDSWSALELVAIKQGRLHVDYSHELAEVFAPKPIVKKVTQKHMWA